MKIVTVIGARPQFIKASVVSRAIDQCAELSEIVVHTGQHFDEEMSGRFFAELGMNRPHYELGVHGGSHASMTGRMLVAIEEVLIRELPDMLLVYGDTNSTLAGALAAAKLAIPIAHIEAGLRSFNLAMPEEVNRIVTDRLSRWLYCPTSKARLNLLREGVSAESILDVGDVMYDAALHHASEAEASARVLERHCLESGGYVLVTIHRQENTDDVTRLAVIAIALGRVSDDVPIVWPLHPRTRAALSKSALASVLRRVKLIEPVGYLEMVKLERHAAAIVTDSGGVQKEAFFQRVPCVTLRQETEWVELVESGWNRLVPPLDDSAVAREIHAAIGSRGRDVEPYGRGDACDKIVSHLQGISLAGVAICDGDPAMNSSSPASIRPKPRGATSQLTRD